MNCLLITSQKGGVGKTTTAVNLAALAASPERRVLLIDADPLAGSRAALGLAASDLGLLCADVAPGLDVWSPTHGDERQPADDQIARLLAREAARGWYETVVLDSPPVKDPAARRLLGLCDEVLIVLRAEPLSLRTLPSMLEAFAEAGRGRLSGLLLTLPPGVEAASSEVRGLTASLGTHLVPLLIRHGPEVERAVMLGRPVVTADPGSAVAKDYSTLADHLGLTASRAAELSSFSGLSEMFERAEAGTNSSQTKLVTGDQEAADRGRSSYAQGWVVLLGLSVVVGALCGVAIAMF